MTPRDYIAQAEQAERLAKALPPGPDREALLAYASRLRTEAAKRARPADGEGGSEEKEIDGEE